MLKKLSLMLIFSVSVISMPGAFAGHDVDQDAFLSEEPGVYDFFYPVENIRGEIVLLHFDSMQKLIERGYLKELACMGECVCPVGFDCEPCNCS